MEAKYKWALKATGIGYLWTILFWYLAFHLLAWRLLDIPIGLAGGIYPVFFSLPVIGLLFGYEILVANYIDEYSFIKQQKFFWTLGLPMFVLALSLIVSLPTETGNLLIIDLWNELFYK